jgi:nicotinamidase-related amidase
MWTTGLALCVAVMASLWAYDRVTAQVELPMIPDPVAVELAPQTTAFLVLDISASNCPQRPACVASLPGVVDLLARSRLAGAPVVYSFSSPVLPEVAQLPDEPSVTSSSDKFFQTDLDGILKNAGVDTVIIVGTAANGAVLYTTFGATARGYTVVVAEDGISSTADFATFLTRWQVLNQPGFNNPENRPLEKGRVTLSRTDLITFKQ